jgi:hypothetical protein
MKRKNREDVEATQTLPPLTPLQESPPTPLQESPPTPVPPPELTKELPPPEKKRRKSSSSSSSEPLPKLTEELSAKRKKRSVAKPLILRVPKKQWFDFELDETNAQVQELMSKKSTKDSFILAASRFLYWEAKLKRDNGGATLVYNEDLLMKYVTEFLYNLSGRDGFCILDLGSFFPELSHVKKFLVLKHGAELHHTTRLNQFLKGLEKKHVPRKSDVFNFNHLLKFINRPFEISHASRENQESLIALFAFFSVARKSEVMTLMVSDVVVSTGMMDEITITLKRSKAGVSSKNYLIKCGGWALKKNWLEHVEQLRVTYGSEFGPNTRIWNRYETKIRRFQQRPIGKNHVSDLAASLAAFNCLVGNYSSHSFRRSAATCIANAGGSELDLCNAGLFIIFFLSFYFNSLF